MILLIDNYDSFSYNLVQYIGTINPHIKVIRNDELTVDEIEKLHPDHIVLSPGPGYPKDAGVCEEVVLKLQGKVPILGVCLGHQGICEVYGATICHAKQLMHDAAMPSNTAPMARPWLSPKMVSERSLPKVFFMAYYHHP